MIGGVGVRSSWVKSSRVREGFIALWAALFSLPFSLARDHSLAHLAQGRVALRPHDAARLRLDHGVVHRVERPLGVRHVVEVDVGVPEGAAGDGVAADADGGDGAYGVEDLKEEALVDIGGKVADVEGCGVEGGGLARGSAVGGGGGGSAARGGGGGRGIGRSRHDGNVDLFCFFLVFYWSSPKVWRSAFSRE